jgi:chemotaxis-related protein WspD
VTRPGDADCWKLIGVFGDGSCAELTKVTHCRNCPVFTRAGRELMERAPPEGYRDEWTSLLAREKDKPTRDQSVIVFRVGEEWLGLDTTLFVEVAEWKRPHRIAHRSSTLLAGIVNIRGQLQLCVSLHGLLQVPAPEQASPSARLLVVAREAVTWVLACDEVHGVHFFPRDGLENVPVTVGEALATQSRGVFRWNERRVGYLNGDTLFMALKKAIG